MKFIKGKSGALILFFIMFFCSACGINDEKQDEGKVTTELHTTENAVIEDQNDWVSNLYCAEDTTQILIVMADGDEAKATLHEKNEAGLWREVLSTDATIGKNGIGKKEEGDGKTPTGMYHFTFGFGIKENPGTVLEYIQVDDSYYWVDDSTSKYYNQFVSTDGVEIDWNSAEHIVDAEESYHYVLALDYNKECVPGLGSAIFLHCTPTGGAGCVAIPEADMVKILQHVKQDCIVIIDEEKNINNY